jgi:energy-coupling factor transporter ATP-binding protein EcfA2
MDSRRLRSDPDDAPTQFFKLPGRSAPAAETDENGPVFVPAPVRRVESPGASLAADDSAAFIPVPVRRPAGDDSRIPGAAHTPVADQAPAAPQNATGSGVLLAARALRREVGKGKVILHDVSLIARPREFVAVVGGSGAGKSTLLGALSGQRRPTSGTVLLDGVPLYEHFEALRLTAVAVWLGTLNAIREVSKEDAIYRRERMVNLRVLPYVASKFAVLFALVLVQCTLLLLVAAMHISFPGVGIVGIWLALVLAATAAVSLALAVSAAVSNPDRAIFAAPLIMLPQILLAGLIVPVSNLGAAQPPAALVTSRWGYEAAGRAAGVVNAAAFPPGFLYRSALDGTALVPLSWLLILMAACAGAAIVLQRRKDSF